MVRLARVDKNTLETLLIRGRWSKKGSMNRRDQVPKILRSLINCQTYLLRPPEVAGEKLRVAIEGEQSKTGKLLSRFDKVKAPYHIASLAEQAPKADFILHLAT